MRRVGAVVVECLGQGSCTHGVGGVRAWGGGEVQQVAEGVQANTKTEKTACSLRAWARTQPDSFDRMLYSVRSIFTFLAAAMSSAYLSAILRIRRVRTDVWSSAYTAFDARASASSSSA